MLFKMKKLIASVPRHISQNFKKKMTELRFNAKYDKVLASGHSCQQENLNRLSTNAVTRPSVISFLTDELPWV